MSEYQFRLQVALQDAKCSRIGIMVDRTTGRGYCLPCFTERSKELNDHAMVIKHYAIKGLPSVHCYKCHKDLAIYKPIRDCNDCTLHTTYWLIDAINHRVRITMKSYRYDHYSRLFEMFNV